MDATVTRTWRDVIVSAHDWESAGPPAKPGAMGGSFMRCRQTQRVAWFKPAASASGNRMLAREKIASDLAHELKLPVPSVLLLRNCGEEGLVERGCLSLVRHHEQPELADVLPGSTNMSPALKSLFAAYLDSRIIAFDAWIGNRDRGSARNTVIGYENGEPPEILFIDYALSMDWTCANRTAISRVELPEPLDEFFKPEGVIEGARQISELADDRILSIVSRIPDDFMDRTARDLLASDLIERRQLVLRAANAWYPGQ